MTFYEALKALNEGKKIRKKWWYAGDYIWLDKENTLKDKNGSETYVSLRFDFKTNNEWEIYEEPILEPILDEAEKKYLSDVLRPFKKSFAKILISKSNSFYISKGNNDKERILFMLSNIDGCYEEVFSLPRFDKGTMYKGMKIDKYYSLEELGL